MSKGQKICFVSARSDWLMRKREKELVFLGTMTHCSYIILQIYIPPTGGELGERGLEGKKKRKKKAKSTSAAAATLPLNGHWLPGPIYPRCVYFCGQLEQQAIRRERVEERQRKSGTFILIAAIRLASAPVWLGFVKIFAEWIANVLGWNIFQTMTDAFLPPPPLSPPTLFCFVHCSVLPSTSVSAWPPAGHLMDPEAQIFIWWSATVGRMRRRLHVCSSHVLLTFINCVYIVYKLPWPRLSFRQSTVNKKWNNLC